MDILLFDHQIDKKKKLFITVLLVAMVVLGWVMAKGNVAVASITLLLPFILFFMVVSFTKPVITLYMMIILSFSLTALDRYVLKDSIPVGTLFDVMVVYVYALLFLKGLVQKTEWKKAGEGPIAVLSIWLLYCVLEIFNPEAPGLNAWFVGVRPFLYMLFSIPLFCMLLTVKSIMTIMTIWGIFTMMMTIKGAIQLYVGLDSVEQSMMTGPFLNTHLLWGQLRVFSLCSDAGQFGASQAHAGLVGAILFVGAKSAKQKLFFLLMCLFGIFGMFISGTRGAIFVIFAGAAVYLVLIKNTKLFILGGVCAAMMVGLLVFTTVGESNDHIRRMRTAFKPDKDLSYQVRVNKQMILKNYLATRPFGGGLGSMADTGTGIKGTVLGDTWSDSGYVLIWGQTGVVGLCLYIGMFLYFLIKGAYFVWRKIKDEWLRCILIASIAGIGGVALAHYGNPIMTQHPTCYVLFFSIAVIFIAPRLDKELSTESINNNEPVVDNQNRELQPFRRNA